MALNCEEKLSNDIQKDCDVKPVGGIEVNVLLINFDDINKTTSTIDPLNDLLITDINLNGLTTGYFVEGIKQAQGVNFELVKKEDTFDGYKHSFTGVVLTPSASNKKSLSEISSGSRYVAVVEKIWKGQNNSDAFEVLGWDRGLVISEMTWNTKESDGIIKFVLASPDGYEEPEQSRNYLQTSYAASKINFDSGFAFIP